MNKQNIILASGSLQRKDVLSSLNFAFDVVPADIDEKAIRNDDLKKQAEMVARAKAEKVAKEREAIVIAADTFVVIGGVTLEKPLDITEAREMLKTQCGKELQVYTGFCYIDKQNDIDFSDAVIINAFFREMSEQEIESYIHNYPVTTWSAGFAPAYSYGMTLIEKIEGSFTGFIYGLPMELLIPLLKKSGYDIGPKV